MDDALKTLLFPFDRGMLDWPGAGGKTLFLGAPSGLYMPSDFAGALALVQDFRPTYLTLEKAGFQVSIAAEGEGYDCALVLMGRHRRENEMRLGEALRRTRPGGMVVAACTKKDGAASMRKRIDALLPLDGHASKYHGVVFWLTRPDALDEAVLKTLAPDDANVLADGFATAPGGFSADGIDRGSALLVDNLPDNISGDVADFAAGWGYLAASVAQRFSVSRVDLYEAHHASLEAARRNMAAKAPGIACAFFWQDLLAEPVGQRYDAIVMNPPFHQARAAEPDIGHRMIEAAAAALKPKGRLFLVANQPLPYEPTLGAHFSSHGEICRDGTFKVLWARKR